MKNLHQRVLVVSAAVVAALAPVLSPASDPLQNPLSPILRLSTSKLIMFLMFHVPLVSNDEKLASIIVGISCCGASHDGATPSATPTECPTADPPTTPTLSFSSPKMINDFMHKIQQLTFNANFASTIACGISSSGCCLGSTLVSPR